MVESDPGPPDDIAEIFSRLPDYAPHKTHFWFDWGPILYRGRLDGSARVICVASDPGPTERIALRTLVGDAGQRVQGMLTRLGLTRSYLCLNAHAYALFPSHGAAGLKLLKDPLHVSWRNELLDRLNTPNLQAIIAFGKQAQEAIDLWPGVGNTPLFKLPHPSSDNMQVLLNAWRAAVIQLRGIVTPDSDGDLTVPNYGTKFIEANYSPIPRRDLPFGTPTWIGDDAWGRSAQPRHNNSVRRPRANEVAAGMDPQHTLIWIAPES